MRAFSYFCGGWAETTEMANDPETDARKITANQWGRRMDYLRRGKGLHQLTSIIKGTQLPVKFGDGICENVKKLALLADGGSPRATPSATRGFPSPRAGSMACFLRVISRVPSEWNHHCP